MAEQDELWLRILSAKRRVLDAFVGKPDPEFRSSQVFQAYTGLCAEAEFAHDDDQLDEETVGMLEEYAGKVISAWQQHTRTK